MRHLSVGLISNEEFEKAIMEDVAGGCLPEQYRRSKLAKSGDDDPIIKPMLELCWGLYDDTRNHRLVKSDTLTTDALKIIARCILFLHSYKEYEWPYFNTNNPLLRFSLKDLTEPFAKKCWMLMSLTAWSSCAFFEMNGSTSTIITIRTEH